MSLKSFLRDQRGSTAVVFTLAIVPLIGAGGAALDYSRSVGTRTAFQAAADNAALAAIKTKTLDTATRENVAKQYVAANNTTGIPAHVAVKVTNKEAVVTVAADVPTTLIRVFGIDTVSVSARSKAVKTYFGPPACVMALAKTGVGIEVKGSASYTGKDCTLHSNSSGTGAITVGGSATVSASGYCAVGTVVSNSTLTPQPESFCDELEDPYASIKAPATTACDPKNTNTSVGPNKTAVLKPGVYCGGLNLQGTVTLQSGLYVIRDGALSLNSQGTIKGDGVTFYLMGSGATFDINGGASLTLSAMQTGDYAGLLIVQDRQSAVGSTSKLNGNSTTVLKGAIYAPTQNVRMNGTGTFGQASVFMPIIANTVDISGNSTTFVDASKTALIAPLPQSASGARLVE